MRYKQRHLTLFIGLLIFALVILAIAHPHTQKLLFPRGLPMPDLRQLLLLRDINIEIAYAGVLTGLICMGLPMLTPLIIAAGSLFSFWHAVVIVTIGRTAACLISFFLARYMLSIKAHPFVQKAEEQLQRRSVSYQLGLRLLPLFPDSLVNYGLGMAKAKFTIYTLTSIIGMFPFTVAGVWVGSKLGGYQAIAQLEDLLPDIVLFLIGMMGIGIVWNGLRLMHLEYKTIAEENKRSQLPYYYLYNPYFK